MNDTLTPPDPSQSDNGDNERRVAETIAFLIEGILIPILAAAGILGNILSVWIFNKKDVELKPSFANLLKCLSVFDTIFLASIFVQYSLPMLSESFSVWVLPLVTPYSVPLIHISLTGSVYSVLAVATERFITVCFPFTQCSMCGGLGYILPILLFSVGYNLSKFWEIETYHLPFEEWQVHENGTNISTLTIYPVNNATELRQDPVYQEYVVFVLNFVMMGLIPVLLLSVLNFMIYRSISRATATHNNISSSHRRPSIDFFHRRDTTMARLLMAIVVVFFCCHSTKIIVNFYEAFQFITYGELPTPPPLWVLLLVRVNHLLLAINSAINIVIYSFKDFKFRAILLSTFKRKKPSSRSFRTSIRSSFGSTRYRHHQSQSLSSRVYNNTEPARTAETSIRESTEDGEREAEARSQAEAKHLICDKNLGHHLAVNDRIRNHDDSV